jgi:hypothetical protein
VPVSNTSSWPGKSAKRVFALDDPAIHAFVAKKESKTWMPGTRPGMTLNVLRINSGATLHVIASFVACAPRNDVVPYSAPAFCA